MNGRGRLAVFVGLTLVGLLAGCVSGSTASPTPSASPAPSAAPPSASTPPATPTPEPSSEKLTAPPGPDKVGPVTIVTGTLTCPSGAEGTTTTPDPSGLSHTRGARLDCTEDADAPEVSGASVYSSNLDTWLSGGAGALVQWGSVRITNAKGSWHGTYTGVWDLGKGDTIAAWYVGSGAYAGLTYFELITGVGPWTIRGQIYPGTPPKP